MNTSNQIPAEVENRVNTLEWSIKELKTHNEKLITLLEKLRNSHSDLRNEIRKLRPVPDKIAEMEKSSTEQYEALKQSVNEVDMKTFIAAATQER